MSGGSYSEVAHEGALMLVSSCRVMGSVFEWNGMSREKNREGLEQGPCHVLRVVISGVG